MLTANDELRDLVIHHSTVLERYKKGIASEIIAYLNDDLEPAVLAKLQDRLSRLRPRGYGKGMHTTERLRELEQAIKDIVEEFTSRARDLTVSDLVKLAKSEAQWQVSAYRRVIPPAIRVNLTVPSPATLRAIVKEGPINGVFMEDWFKNINTRTAEAVTKSVNIGLGAGETTTEIVSRVRGTPKLNFTDGAMQGTRHEIVRVTHTATTHVTNQARSQTAKENSDLVKGEQWVATLDNKTCPVCGRYDSNVYPLGSGPRPPAHVICRCSMIPVLKSWRDMGYDIDELPPGTRASMDGQVPGDTTFTQWLKRQPPGRVAGVLGSKSAAAKFLAGEVTFDAFSTEMGTPLSLKQVLELGDG